jgi:hypothetical protein
MDIEIGKLQSWLKTASSYELPSFKELPTVPLYMEQVVGYINQTLSPLTPSDTQLLTSFMVNNYVKAKILKEPNNKKYNVEHLGYLLALTTLKRTLSMSEISLLIEMDKDVSIDKSVLYGFFKVMAKDILQETARKTESKTASFVERYGIDKKVDPVKADIDLRDSLGLIALRLSIQASVDQALAEVILTAIAKETHSEKEFEIESKPTPHEVKRENRLNKGEARRLALAKKIQKKK